MTPSPLTPRMAGVLDRIRRTGRPPLHSLGVAQARAADVAAAEILDLPRAPLSRVVDLTLAARGATPPLAARLYAPWHATLPAVVYFHGGGFTIGGLETHDSLCRQLALRSGAAVIAVDYRLAPENQFPAAVDDAWAALAGVADEAPRLGIDRRRLAVAGDSAGATLATVAAIHARDAGLELRAQVLVTPGTAPTTDSASHQAYASGYLLDAAAIDWFFGHYIAPDQRRDWRFAPLEADDLEGVAPALLVLAECDPLADEGLAYADRLRAAGVAVELELYRGVTHEFIKMGRVLPEAISAQQAIADVLQRALFA